MEEKEYDEYQEFLDYCDAENDMFREMEERQLAKYIEDSI